MDLSEAWAQLCAANERWTASDLRPMWEHEGPRPGLSESECWDVRRHHPEVPDAVPPRSWRACGYAASGTGVAVVCS